jgi:UDP-3-O-acyl N-acetylglucosamine deacetylase
LTAAFLPEKPAVKRIGSRPQRTLQQPVSIRGVGFITGSPVEGRLLPAPVGSGRQFQRVDLPNAAPIPARVESVSGTDRRTTLGQGSNQVTLVEHLLSALAGLRIDNCTIELNAPEPPGLDGSAWEFVQAIQSVGAIPQKGETEIWATSQPLKVSHNGATLSLHPEAKSHLKMSYLLHYGERSIIPSQTHTLELNPSNYLDELARCRTFVLEQEAYWLQTQGIGLHLTSKELLVYGAQGVIDNELRFADEPARHKLLDMVGDLSLSGVELVGHLVGYRSGHPLNVELARQIARATREQGRSLTRLAA